MKPETTAIQLPPRKRPEPRSSGGTRTSTVILWVFAAMIGGLAIGIFAGKYLASQRTILVKSPPQTITTTEQTPTAPEIEAKLSAASEAINEGNWLESRALYQEILSINPDQAVAKAALPLIERHLATARGQVIVEAVPTGALVKLGAFEEKPSPAVFDEVPFGNYEMVISHPGHEPTRRRVTVDDAEVKVAGIDLARSTGALRLSSIPEGVEFKLMRMDDAEELVRMGKTPATIEQLDAGEYRVHMALTGWPDYQEKVKVDSHRNASVSHIFARGGLKITSDPSEAEVWLKTDATLPPRKLGGTPLNALELPVGRHRLELRYRDWPPIQRTVEVREGEAVALDFAWKRGAITFRSDPPGAKVLRADQPANGESAASVTPFTAEFPEGTHTFVAQYPGLDPVVVEAEVAADETGEALFRFDYGSVSIASDPAGATVMMNGKPLGRTPYQQEIVRPGPQIFALSLDRHRSTTVEGEVKPGQSLNFDARLVFDPAPKIQSDFVNSQGLKMVWIDALHGWVGAHEVPQAAFEGVMHENPSDFAGDTIPVQGVTWYQADRFCQQLTSSERGSGQLPRGYRYSLPTDEMWSFFAGSTSLDNAITSRDLRREGPAPVGSLPANEFGLFDVRGNLWEWCDDWYSLDIVARSRKVGATVNNAWVGTERKVLRGGSWNRSSGDGLDLGYRYANRPSASTYEIGFRVVLMPE